MRLGRTLVRFLHLERHAGRSTRHSWVPYAFVALPAAYIGGIQLFILLRGFWLSLTATNLLAPSDSRFVGFGNFQTIISSPPFLHSLQMTLLYTAGSLGGALALGLGAALLLNGSFRGRGIARAFIAIPWATPGVAVALVFTWIFNDQFGVLNFLLTRFGILGDYTTWLDNPDHAMLAVLIPTIWQLFPVCALVILAALQAVSEDLVEAARIDGADAISVFGSVVLPSIRPTLATIALLATIWSFRRFELLWLLTQGGPADATNTLAIEVYRETFQYADLGTGAAVGMIGLGLSLVVTLAYFWLMGGTRTATEQEGTA